MVQKEYYVWLDEKGYQLGIVQKIMILPCWQMAYALSRIGARKWNAQNHLKIYDTNRSPDPSKNTRPNIN